MTTHGMFERWADAVTELDAHLSAGGIPPEAWREGPDAPADEESRCPLTGRPLRHCAVSSDGRHACVDLRKAGGGWFTWAEYEREMSR